MPETQTPFLKLIQPDIGGSKSTWGNRVNGDLQKIDDNALMERKAELTGLQNGGNAGFIIDADGETPLALTDERFRTSVALQLYSDTVIDDPTVAAIQLRPGALAPVHWVLFLLDSMVPVGTILMWWGEEDTIPAGWRICDGADPPSGEPRTPDMRGRFPLGAWPDYTSPAGFLMDAGATGGTAGDLVHTHDITVAPMRLTRAQIPPHTHGTNANGSDAVVARTTTGGVFDITGGGPPNGYGSYSISDGSDMSGGPGDGTGKAAEHAHTATSAGNTEPPPYRALAFIMKVKALYTALP